MKYTINESEEWDSTWVSIDVTVKGRTFQVWVDKHGVSVLVEHEVDDKFWVPTGVNPNWEDLEPHPIEEICDNVD